MAWLLILSIFLASDTIEVNGTRGLYYRIFVQNGNLYFQCKAKESWYKPMILDSGNCSSPAISVTAKDYIHVVWQRRDGEQQSIYYKTTPDGVSPSLIYQNEGEVSWSEKVPVSYVPSYPTEPASNPSTETYGDKIYVAWRGPYDSTNMTGEVWKRWKLADPSVPWERQPQNESQSETRESDYPVMSTSAVIAWQESLSSNNWEIYAKVNSPIINISNTSLRNSRYPHITASLSSPENPGEITIHAIWTEDSFPAYEVRYQNVVLPCTSSPDYFSVNPGESIPSPYLEERTGYLQYEQYKIDYGRNRLLYRLPYLNPQYDYLAMAVVFSGTNNRIRQNFILDDSTVSLIEFEPFKPETIWVKIPENTYKTDLQVREQINKLIGNFAVLADLKIYQYEENLDGSSGGGIMGDNIGLSLRPILYNCLPNPFRSQTMIRYQLPSPALVSLKVYDIMGKVVRNLVNGPQKAGDYRVRWDGKDSEGKSLGNGIYFYALKTKDFSAIKKLVLIR